MFSYLPFYQTYQTVNDMLEPLRHFSNTAADCLTDYFPCAADTFTGRMLVGSWRTFDFLKLTHSRPAFGIESVKVGRQNIAVSEEVVMSTPFCDLLHFKKDSDEVQPKVLVVVPMSGHFATLLTKTVDTLLIDHDVYVTDWYNIRDVPLNAGKFGFDEYTEHVIQFLEFLGSGVHLLGVCQPAVPVLIAASIMAQDNHPNQPRSMILMAGPIDTRISPTVVNELATDKPISWFEKNVIGTVPGKFAGAGRRVYPGFLQISAFMSMNIDNHFSSFLDFFNNTVQKNEAEVSFTRTFYEEYFAMMDLSADFYLETVQKVFQEHQLPRGVWEFKGRRVDPSAIRRTALMTVEGQRDDICSLGQTMAAHDLCTGLHPFKKAHHMQAGVGHYGVFSGRRWQTEVYPLVRDFIMQWER